jgi:hypothetical protein
MWRRGLELAQAAGLWLLAKKETWPGHRPRARRCTGGVAAGERRLYAVVESRQGGEAFDARVVDEKGLVHAEVVGYRTVASGRATLPS